MGLRERLRRFGFDAPYVVIGNLAVIVLALILWFISRSYHPSLFLLVAGIVRNCAIFCLIVIIFYVYATTTGKFRIWQKLSSALPLEGKFLDVGCGRGMVLTLLGQESNHRELYGVDIWRSVDQMGNSQEKASMNFAPHTEMQATLVRGDAREMPFDDNYFDVIVSSLALHNIKNPVEEIKAIQEILRVLKPSGQLVIADIGFATAPKYLKYAQAQLENTELKSSGLQGWVGPWYKTFVLQGSKKVSVSEVISD